MRRTSSAVRSVRRSDALPTGLRAPRERADLDLLLTLILMAVVLLALCIVLGGVPSRG